MLDVKLSVSKMRVVELSRDSSSVVRLGRLVNTPLLETLLRDDDNKVSTRDVLAEMLEVSTFVDTKLSSISELEKVNDSAFEALLLRAIEEMTVSMLSEVDMPEGIDDSSELDNIVNVERGLDKADEPVLEVGSRLELLL